MELDTKTKRVKGEEVAIQTCFFERAVHAVKKYTLIHLTSTARLHYISVGACLYMDLHKTDPTICRTLWSKLNRAEYSVYILVALSDSGAERGPKSAHIWETCELEALCFVHCILYSASACALTRTAYLLVACRS